MRSRCACLLALATALAVVSAQSAPDYCQTSIDLYFNAGGYFLPGSNVRCDVGEFVNVATWTYTPNNPPIFTGDCTDQYLSHRSTNSDMEYNIPVPPGDYTVYLGFAETFWKDATRKFTITVNDVPVTPPGSSSTTISIFELAGGANIPYVIPVNTSAVAGGIKVAFGYIPGSDNPFISSIGVVGTGATDVIGGQFLTACSAPTVEDTNTAASPTPSIAPSASVAPSPSAAAPVTSAGDISVIEVNPDYCPAIADVFINAGGPNLPTNYRCDEDYFSANASSYTPAVPPAYPGECTAQYVSHRFKFGSFSYNIPVPAGVYSVILQWAETFADANDTRLFTVTVNGKPVTPPGSTGTNFDIYALAGGMNVPYAINVTTLDDNGFINVDFGAVAGKDNPFISAIGVSGLNADGVVGVAYLGTCIPPSQALAPSASFTPGASPSASLPPGASPSPTATPQPETTTMAMISTTFNKCPAEDDVFINVGGKNLATGYRCDDANDTYVTSGGSWVYSPPNPVSPPGNCSMQYVSHRVPAAGVGYLEYTVPVPAGSYTVYVQMMETFFNTTGARLFNISVNGEYAAVDGSTTIDLFALKGLNEPLMVTVSNVEAVTGEIKVAGFSIVDNVLISGIGIKGNGVNASGIVGDTRLNDCGAGVDVAPPGLGPVQPVPIPSVAPPSSGTVDDLYVCPMIDDVFINVGGDFLVDDIRCDNGNYFTGNTFKFAIPDATVTLPGACSDHYKTHRYALNSAMTFTLPVAPGTYSVYLMFMESFITVPGGRLFSIDVQGAPLVHPNIVNGTLDIYDQAGGMNIPLLLNLTNVEAPTGSISVKFNPVVENPMVSGIAVVGQGATKILGTGFINTCQAPPTVSDCSAVKFSDSADPGHVAHSVSGGPYVETDFDKDGKAIVQLDGLGSHSHESFPENGVIVKYEWSWTDASNPAADNAGMVTATTGRPAPSFPLGTTQLKLTVTDQFCNAASETTTVTVNPATKEGAYCYYYDLLESNPVTVPLPVSINDAPKPQFAQEVGDINFGTTASFGVFPFSATTFAVRCVFDLDIATAGTSTYSVVHNGPVKVYFGADLVASSNVTAPGTVTPTSPLNLKAGLNAFQVLYLRKDATAGELKFQNSAGVPVPQTIVRYDASTVIPVIESLSDTTALASEIITIKGTALVNGVQVKFGDVLAEPITSSATSIQLRVPPQQGVEQVVDVTIETLAGISNSIKFIYGSASEKCQLINFATTSLKTSPTQDLQVNNIAVIKYGPDGRLYGGATNSKLYAWTLDQNLVVTKACTKNVINNFATEAARNVLGIAFNPKSLALKMFFTTSTFYWTQKNKPGLPLSNSTGWRNGKVQSITLNGTTSCFNNDISDVVSNLPVTDHDHGVNFLQFLPDGRLIIAIGGFTNGGISVPGDGLGGIPAPPYAGAIITCPITNAGVTVTYANPSLPGENAVADDTSGCSIYAAGLRNTFAAELHTNGELYATDNGPNQGFGEFSDSCDPNQVPLPSKNNPDRLLAVKEGKCHGHPHLGRGKLDPQQCIFDFFGFKTTCVKGLILNLQSSTNGVLEYRSNFFAGALKGNLMLSKYSLGPGKKGSIRRVELKEDGTVLKDTPLFEDDSGLAIAEGPRGEVIMSRVFKNTFLVYKPVCLDNFDTIYLIGVLPRRGPAAGGQVVTVSGFNFGTAPIVTFGTQLATAVSVSADGQSITCTTPAGTAGTQVKVTVTGTTGENLATTGSDYWYW